MGAGPAAVTTAGLWEKTQSAQWLRSARKGLKSSCRWTDCAKPMPAMSSMANTAVRRQARDRSNWRANFILTYKDYNRFDSRAGRPRVRLPLLGEMHTGIPPDM